MGKYCFVLPVLVAFAIPTFAQVEYADAKTKAECTQYAQTPLPAEAASFSAPAQWPACASYKLHSGIGTKVDLEAARKCAWQERLASQAGLEPRHTVASVLGGAATLAQLYANADGVERNIPLAIRFACEAGGAPAEIGGRIEHLESLAKQTIPPKENFKFCDDITSGFMQGFCEAYESELADQSRANALSNLSSKWSESQRQAFATLTKAHAAYAKAHGSGEIDTSGTARAAEEISAEQSLRDSFLAAIQIFEKGSLPNYSATEVQKADTDLNQIYRKAITDAEANKSKYGAVQPEGIRAAERAWLTYRDAWTQFAKLHYPAVSAESWLTLLTKDRIATIQGGPCEFDPDNSQCEQQDTHAPRPLP
ncbi:lysozyme inhibitor LprI family protein [Acidicapsa acidisoli]|uniref:lysozyme inhibitor LprI family protein n=1 Tax=Acidicapsa acidisoli TaxID=1615681 RepID=UPI0021DF58B2|nr:lysozyme inhibitor LprI family protein [Acidicapsa acidisoli]